MRTPDYTGQFKRDFTGAARLVADRPGCVTQLRGGAEKQGINLRVDHGGGSVGGNLENSESASGRIHQ
jgi:Fe-S oxidoreductase